MQQNEAIQLHSFLQEDKFLGLHSINKDQAMLSQVRKFFHIVLVERRIPIRAFRLYYNFLDFIGVSKTSIVTKNGFVIEGLSNSFWMYHETWDKDDYGIPGLELFSGATVIDIGANQGFYSLYAASKGARVFAFEPSDISFRILTDNVNNNNIGNLIRCVNAAVTSESGNSRFYEGFDNNGRFLSGSASVIDENRGGSSVTIRWIKTVSLDDIFRDYNIDYCDLLKIDCEGAEYQILGAATSYSFDRIRYIALEFHSGRIQELKDSLNRGGFEVISVVGQVAGLLKAKKKNVDYR